jgi:hypothetical protein
MNVNSLMILPIARESMLQVDSYTDDDDDDNDDDGGQLSGAGVDCGGRCVLVVLSCSDDLEP